MHIKHSFWWREDGLISVLVLKLALAGKPAPIGSMHIFNNSSIFTIAPNGLWIDHVRYMLPDKKFITDLLTA